MPELHPNKIKNKNFSGRKPERARSSGVASCFDGKRDATVTAYHEPRSESQWDNDDEKKDGTDDRGNAAMTEVWRVSGWEGEKTRENTK